MDLIKGLVHYGGQWDETNTYSDYEVAGIFIPNECCLQNLKSLISQEIGAACDHIQIAYRLHKGQKPINILTDNSVKFYIDMRKSCNEVAELPLCLQPPMPTSSTDTVFTRT